MNERLQIDGSTALKKPVPRLITIEPTKKTDEVKLRVAAYTRVSTSSDDQLNSFAAQNQYYTTRISENQNWEMVDIYADEGISGTAIRKRTEFQRMIADCRKGKIDRILVKSISRFARNTAECLMTLRELKLLGVSVFFEKEIIDTAGTSGELLTALFASFAQLESENISGNMRWGIQARMKEGNFVPSHQPYGYQLIDHEIVIDAPRAKVVCEIFHRYLSGQNTWEIAELLNRMQIEHPDIGERVWTHKAIARILKNEKYIGDSLWQKTYRTDTLPAKEHSNRGEQPQYYAYNTHPAIIDKAVFENTQQLIASRRRSSQADPHNSQPLDQAKIICAHCGRSLRKKITNGKTYRVCRTHDANAESCQLRPVLAESLCDAFLRLYFNLKHQGNSLLEEIVASLQTIRSSRMLWSEDVIALNKEISDLSSQNQMLARLNQQGLIDPDIFICQSNELTKQIRETKRKKERLLDQDGDCTLNQTQELLDVLASGPHILESFDTEIFQELVDSIFVESNAGVRFRLKNGLELTETIERTVR